MTRELDFYDKTLRDILAEVPNADLSASILRRLRRCEAEFRGECHGELVGLGGEESSRGEECAGEEEEEQSDGEHTWTEPERSTITSTLQAEEEGEDRTSPQDDESEFTTGLWSARDSHYAVSVDDWDVSRGAVPWEEAADTAVHVLSYADLELTAQEEDGELTGRIVAACSSFITQTPGRGGHVFGKANLGNKNLSNIEVLCSHRFLQYIDLSWNNLKDITPLSCVPYLMYLDVSHNLLEEVLRFEAPWNLAYVNYSHNAVFQIDDLSAFWSLTYLDLSYNHIAKIKGLHNLKYLRYLDLAHNKIERFENLNGLNITDLNLEFNLISRFEAGDGLGMFTLPYLNTLYLGNNSIKTLSFLQGVYHLKKLEMQDNDLSDMAELPYLESLKSLRCLDLSRNPVCDLPRYRQVTLNLLPACCYLDQTVVEPEERVGATLSRRRDPLLEGSRQNARLMLLEQLNCPAIDTDLLAVDEGAQPLVVLVGPPASGKRTLARQLADKFPEQVRIGRLLTTRHLLPDEDKFFTHVTREEFYDLTKEGKFLCVMEFLGHLFGFSREELGMAVVESKVCLSCMDLEGAVTIHSYGIQPCLVLTMVESAEGHSGKLLRTYGAVIAQLGAAFVAERLAAVGRCSGSRRSKDILRGVVEEEEAEGSEVVCGEQEGWSLTSHFDTTDESYEASASGTAAASASFTCSQDSGAGAKTVACRGHCTTSTCGQDSVAGHLEGCLYGSERREGSATGERVLSGQTALPSTQDTSYSALWVDMRIRPDRGMSGDGEGTPEEDTFASWSLPFIDWDELQLDTMDVDEAAERLGERCIASILATRDIYLSLHRDNPGMFALCVFTDDTDKALARLTEYMTEVCSHLEGRPAVFTMESDETYRAVMPKRLAMYSSMLLQQRLAANSSPPALPRPPCFPCPPTLMAHKAVFG